MKTQVLFSIFLFEKYPHLNVVELYCIQKHSPEVFYKKTVLKSFAKFTKKTGFLFNKVAGQAYFEEHLRTVASVHFQRRY